MMRYALLGALLLVTAACGAYSFPGGGPATPGSGTVSGRVVSVPCAPVEQAGQTCAGKPVPNLELDYVGHSPDVIKTVTDANGNYSLQLDPGSYAVKIKSYMQRISGPLSLTVAAGSSTTANYVLDNGIRVPAPQQ